MAGQFVRNAWGASSERKAALTLSRSEAPGKSAAYAFGTTICRNCWFWVLESGKGRYCRLANPILGINTVAFDEPGFDIEGTEEPVQGGRLALRT